jgi:MoxR-like ATPase
VNVGYPEEAAERRKMIETTGSGTEPVAPVMPAAELIAAQALVRRLPVGDRVVDAILALVRAGRPQSSPIAELAGQISWGPGPRASQALMLTVRVRALLQGRLAPSVEDVIALAPPVLRHRMALTFIARAEGISLDQVIDRLCAVVR